MNATCVTLVRRLATVYTVDTDQIELIQLVNAAKAIVNRPATDGEYIDVVFDGPPSHISGRFVEVENPSGQSICVGSWLQREDGYWVLRIQTTAPTIS